MITSSVWSLREQHEQHAAEDAAEVVEPQAREVLSPDRRDRRAALEGYRGGHQAGVESVRQRAERRKRREQPEGRQRSVDPVVGPGQRRKHLRRGPRGNRGSRRIERHTMKRSLARGHARGQHEAIKRRGHGAGRRTEHQGRRDAEDVRDREADRHPRDAQGSQVAGDGQRQKHQPFVADRTLGQIANGVCDDAPAAHDDGGNEGGAGAFWTEGRALLARRVSGRCGRGCFLRVRVVAHRGTDTDPSVYRLEISGKAGRLSSARPT